MQSNLASLFKGFTSLAVSLSKIFFNGLRSEHGDKLYARDPSAAAYLAGACGARIVDLMATFRTHGLEPMTYAAEAWKTGQIFGAPNITHPDFASRTGDVLWGLSFLTVDVPHAPGHRYRKSSAPHSPERGGSAWHWLVKLAEDLCDGLGADLGMINGFAIRRKQGGAGGPVYGPEIAPAIRHGHCFHGCTSDRSACGRINPQKPCASSLPRVRAPHITGWLGAASHGKLLWSRSQTAARSLREGLQAGPSSTMGGSPLRSRGRTTSLPRCRLRPWLDGVVPLAMEVVPA